MPADRTTPPRFFTRLFERFCKQNLYDELQGDLEEEFYLNLEEFGIARARKLYRREVLKMLRPSVVKKIRNQPTYYNHTAMFRNYSIVAFRNLSRNRLFSAINIIGLAISMAVGLIAITFVSEIYSYDNFHDNRDRLFRVVSNLHRTNGNVTEYATASVFAGNRLANDFAGFEAVAPLTKGFRGEMRKGESSIAIQGIYANNDFFKVLSFQLLAGNSGSALTEPNSVILTETAAQKLFDRSDVVGEIIEWKDQTPYKITGVLKDPPSNSHLKFDAIASLKTLEEKNISTVTDFGVIWASHVYVLLPENYDLQQIQTNLDKLAEEENPKLKYWQLSLGLERFDDIFPSTGKANQFSTVMPKEKVTSIVVLALIVLFSACFNYTNLSLARSLKRSKEIGVRKVVGAGKTHLFLQFIIEAILVAVIAVIISYGLFQLIKPEFLALDFYIQRTTTLDLQPINYLYFFLFAVAIGILAGLFPSLLMTRFKPVNILKGVSVKTSKGVGLRKVLVGIQFALSMGFATLVTMTYKQYKYALNFDLGFTTENILNVEVQSNTPEVLKSQFQAVPEVAGVSSASIMPSTGNSMSNFVKYKNPLDSVTAYTMDIGPDYLTNMGHQLLAGPGFEKEGTGDRAIVNELFLKEIGINKSSEAIGEQISFYNKTWMITGVVKDFHYGTIKNELEPFIFTMGRQDHYYLNVKLKTNDITATMNRLESAWKEVDNVHPFEARFYDDWLQDTYSDMNASLKTFGLLSGVAICISILGLLGMAVYNAESRLKELAIRKVLGATLSSLMLLLSRSFMGIFILSACVAIPLAYYIYEETIVSTAVYKINIGFWELASGALLIVAVALLTISSQTMKAARSNPAESLRNE
ncbi:MAG: FtsX-like permease family protein [Roseivirga sp.]|nr:FtsX-like permease family protein [Roseivirga sp.]